MNNDDNNAIKVKDAEAWLEQAKLLSEALPFMRRNHGKTIVIKYGGHAMGDRKMAKSFARDVVLLRQTGSNPIVVHGGGPQIGQMLERLNISSNFVDGLRVTDQETVNIVEMVLSGTINKGIVQDMMEAGGFAVGLSGKDGGLLRAERLKRTRRDPDSATERLLDLGLVGEPREVDPRLLNFFEASDATPVIAPIAIGPDGETLNVNADTAAGAVAAATHARRLLMLTDVPGVLDKSGNLIGDMTISEARALIGDGTISGGMIPKVETCIRAVEGGVAGAVIIDGRLPRVVLLELFTEHGAGTLIGPDH